MIGGGVIKQPQLLPLIRREVKELLADYVRAPQFDGPLDDYLVAPALSDRAGVLGSLELARQLVLANAKDAVDRVAATAAARLSSTTGH